ncbi:MAG: tRNA ((37)-N6)-threonylcarbamoyltransferase complex transferase subunit TsaD [Bacteroidota bacterium]|jgi:N6-L-threonylcarbamoyladenine synthase
MVNQQKPLIILGIESSCDETSASVCVDGQILSNITATQAIHEQYGGVIPEVASRIHQQNIIPVVDAALAKAKIRKNEITAVAFTQGPGLMGALLVGTSFAKAFALALNIPLIGINHMQAHILAHFIDDPKPSFPFICLTVSGGHTQIVLVKDYFEMEVLGETTDDAAGEAFDKTAKILGLPYPGGPLIDKYAHTGNPNRFQFTEPQIPNYDFSFSGLKTQILYFVQQNQKSNPNFVAENLADICASIQDRIVSILINKLKKATIDHGIKQISVAGGVSANSGLRKAIEKLAKENNWEFYLPAFQYCTDNAGMVAIAGFHKYHAGKFLSQSAVPLARMPIAIDQ